MPNAEVGIDDEFIRVGALDEVKSRRALVVQTGRCPLLVVWDGMKVVAFDNRCPHLGFPLHRGTIADGILTCHWHHARFDLASGGAFDLWADDIPMADVKIHDGAVWVRREPRYSDGAAHWRNRLSAGLEHNLSLVLAKAILGLTAGGTSNVELVREAALFGVRSRDSWGPGLSILTALANLVPQLPEEETYLALYQGIQRVAEDSDGRAPHRERRALSAGVRPPRALANWLGHWTRGRQRDAAERTLLTALVQGAGPKELAEMMLIAASDRYFADGGHAIDFINKAFECLEVIGWSHAGAVLPSVVGHLVEAQGGEELDAWHHPVDLVALCDMAFAGLAERLTRRLHTVGPWRGHVQLAQAMLGDDPAAVVDAIARAIDDGALPTDLSRALAYAAALRVARFGTTNEFSDWLTAHHLFTYCNALHQMLKRIGDARPDGPNPATLRGVFHGAMRLWMIRFLNVPAARLPGETNDRLDGLPATADELRQAFLSTLDRQGEVVGAARIVTRYLTLKHPSQPLIATLAHAVLREDADFHTFQMLEAAVRQAQEWGDTSAGQHILIAAARYIAAHSPTARARLQTALVARRLARGQTIHEPLPEAAG